MDTRLLRAVRCLVEIRRRQSHSTLRRWRPSLACRSRPSYLINVALRLAIQAYDRSQEEARGVKSALVITKRSKKTAAAVGYLSGLIGSPLPCVVHGHRTLALAACLDHREARACGLRFRPLHLIKALGSITRSLDPLAGQQIIGLVFAYWNYRMVLRRWRPAFFICVSDLSPRRVAAACAANVSRTPVFFYQEDWHHDIVPPFATDAASVLNATGLKSVQPSLRSEGIVATRGTLPSVVRIKMCPKSLKRVGIALNNFFNVDALMNLVRRIADEFPGAEIVVRQHPRSTMRLGARCDSMVEAPAGQSLADFAAPCDVVLVGNSAVQMGLLLAGVAVIHVGDLDNFVFDAYGHVSARIVYGSKFFEGLDVDAVNRFYSDAAWRERFVEKLGLGGIVEMRVLPEADLRNWVSAMLETADGNAVATGCGIRNNG